MEFCYNAQNKILVIACKNFRLFLPTETGMRNIVADLIPHLSKTINALFLSPSNILCSV